MNKQLLCRAGILLTVLFMASVHSFAQKASCSSHITNRATRLDQQGEERKIRILDQYGNEFSPADITPEKGRGSRSGCNPNTCVAGLFTLNFQDAIASNGVGFDDCTASGGSTVGQLRQAVVCQVFRDLSNLLYDVSAGANNGRVNIWIHSNTSYAASIAPWPSGVGGLNSAFYVLPNGLNNVVVDNEIWKTIRGGINSYTGLPAAFNPSGSSGLYHGLIAIDFSGGSSWNLNLDILNPAGRTDLYEVVLHEAIHGLGFNSLIASNGASKFGGDIYSRYDTYLRLNSTPLISFTAPNNWAYTGGLASLGINCNGGQLFNFNGPSLANQPVFTQAAWSNGTNLSHFGCDLANGSICGTAYAQPASDYVMNPCSGQGPTFTKRHPNLSEVRSLCDMSYRLKVSSGNATYGDAPSLTAAAETYILSTFADCSGACAATGYTDNFTTAFDQNITINHSAILANDKDNSGAALTTGTVNYPILYTPGAGTLTLNAGNFVFDPASNFTGMAVVGYYPRCNGSTINGSLTFVFINVASPTLPVCTAPGLCNMICNGDFEASNFSGSWANLDVQGTNDNSPDLFEFNGTNTFRLDGTTGLPLPGIWNFGCGTAATSNRNPQTPSGGNQYMGIGGHPSNIESITFHLNSPMTSGNSYRLSFLASGAGAASTGCLPANLRVFGDDMLPCPISQTTLINGSVSTCGFTAVNLGTSANIDSPQWKLYSMTITPASTITDLVMALSPGTQTSGFLLYALFDNFDLRLISTRPSITVSSIVKPSPVCLNINAQVTYTVCLDTPQTSNANAIPLQLTLPPGFTIAGGDFNVSGLYTIPAGTLTTINRCIDLNVILSMNPSLVTAGASYNIVLTPGPSAGCVSGPNPQNIAVITPVVPAITFTKSASTITPVNGVPFTFNFELCNQSATTQSVTMTDVLPTQLGVTDYNGWTPGGGGLTRTVSISGGTPANPTCQQYSFTVRPDVSFSGATQCNYQSVTKTNTASAQYTGSPCGPVTSSVTVTIYSHRVVGSAVNIPTISQAVAQAMLLPGTGGTNSTNTTQTFTIAGTFAIDMDYQFGSSSSIVHSYAWCAPGASVNVNDYKKLSGYYLDFNACSQMWRGITVAGRYIFFNWEGELVLDHCQVNDALYGVQAMNMSKLSLTNNQFRECFVGIYLPDHSSSIPSSPSVVLNLPLAGNVFYSAGNMKAAYPGMVTSSQQPPVGTIPATNRRTWAGINIEGWSSLAVGTTGGGYSGNSFTGIANGIVSTNSDLNVVSSFFDQHRAYGYSFGAIQGNAIYCTAPLQLVIGNPASAGKGLYQRGNGYNTNPYNCNVSISNSDFGIVATGMNVDVANNCFSAVGTGITVTGAKYGTIRVNSNNFSTSNGAISLVNNDPVNITDIGNNTILNSGGLIALGIQEQNNPPVQYTTVHNNIVIMSGNTWVGINISGCTGVVSLFSSVNVYSNTIVLQNPASHLHGMNFNNSHVIDAFLNSIGGDTWISPATQNSVFTGYPASLALNSSDGRFFCDSTFRLYNGIKLFGTCLNSDFFGNVMNTHTYGFYLTGGATLQAQGSATVSKGNKWRGVYTGGNAARNDNGSGSNIYVQGTAAPYWPAAVGTVVPSSGWVLSSTGAPYLCGAVVYGAGFGGFKKEEEQELSDAERSVIKNEMRFNDFETSLKWQNEKVVFEKLKAAPELMDGDDDAGVFYSAQRNTTLAALSNLEGEKNNALQVDVAKRADFSRLSAERETLVAELINADAVISDKSSAQELDAWRSNKAAIQLKIDEVNKQLGTLRQVMNQSRMQKLTAAASANEQISADLLIEKNQKLLNSIYLNTVAADKYTFTDEQLKDLKYLAGQCPLEGGEAVYRSRSLLSLVMDTFYDDYGLCAVAAKNVKKGSESAGARGVDGLKLNTLPNPASSYLIIQSNISTEENLSVVVYDNMGRSVLEQPISLGSKQTRINTQLLASGLYYIKVFSPSSSPVYSGKFNIQR
jgi:hypothetical protein